MQEQQEAGALNAKESLVQTADRIYLEAFPFYSNRFDLTALRDEQGNTVQDSFLNQWLLKPGARLQLAPVAGQESVFRHLYLESRNMEKIRGYAPLAAGFPLLRGHYKGGLLLAPVALWPARLEPDPYYSGKWILSRSGNTHPRINRKLLGYLEEVIGKDQAASLSGIEREAFADDREWLEQLLLRLASILDTAPPSSNKPILSCPDLSSLDDQQPSHQLYWSGLLGLFPPPVVKAQADYSLPAPESVSVEGTPLGPFSLDPQQAAAFRLARRQRLTVVDGKSGSGKTHLVVQLLVNALLHGRRSLVIAPTLSRLRECQKRLAQLEVDQYAFLLRDNQQDAQLLKELVRAAAVNPSGSSPFDEQNYQQTLSKWERLRGRLQRSFDATRKAAFGATDWTETVGLFLRSNKREGKELLGSQLHATEFRFDREEYEEMKASINRMQALFEKVNTLKHPLAVLHSDIFRRYDQEGAEAFILRQIDRFHDRLSQLHLRYINKFNTYTDLLLDHYEHYYHELAGKVEGLRDAITDNIEKYGKDFELTSLTSLRLYGSLIPKYREMHHQKEDIFDRYRQLVQAFEQQPYFDHDFSPSAEGRNLGRVESGLEAFKTALDQWWDQLNAIVQDEVSRLNRKTVHPAIPFRETIAALEDDLDFLLEGLNEAGLYEAPFENKMLTISKRRRYLEEVIEQLENTRLFMRDFTDFYPWRKNWLHLSDTARKVILALAKVKPSDWMAAYESWFFNNALGSAYDTSLPTKNHPLEELEEYYQKLRPLIPRKIARRWQQHRDYIIRDVRREEREVYQMVFGKQAGETASSISLRRLLQMAGRTLSEILPIFFMTPDMARQWPLGKEQQFDSLIFLDAHALSAQANRTLLSLGKQVLVAGNADLYPGPPEDTLLGEICAAQYPMVQLNDLHRHYPGHFLQRARVKGAEPETAESTFLYCENVGGRYKEEERVNDEEARRVIELLGQIDKTPQRTFPTIGIVTFTVEQRNRIHQALTATKREHTAEAERIKQLERNGLGVFSLQEMPGQHFDYLLLSVTFAATSHGMSAHLQSLDRPSTQAALRSLLAVPQEGVFLVHSIPETFLQDFSQQSNKKGTYLISNYIYWVRACHNHDLKAQHTLIENLDSQLYEAVTKRIPAVFLEEVAQRLSPYLSGFNIQRNIQSDRLFFPLLLDNDLEPTVLLPEGFFSLATHTDFHWEYAQHQYYRKFGYGVQNLWSVYWWKHPDVECRRLASAVIREVGAQGSAPEEEEE